MQKVYAMCILVASAAADRCDGGICDGNLPHGRSLLQKDAASSLKQNHLVADDHRDVDDNEGKSSITNLDLDVKIMEKEFADMNAKMKVVEETLGVTTQSPGTSGAAAAPAATSLQQESSEPSDHLQARISLLETNVADLLSRTIPVEKEVGVAQVSLLDDSKEPVIGLANRAIAVQVRVHDLQGRITKLEHVVLNGLKPDATLMTKEVEVLEGKVNALKTSVQGPATPVPATSLLGVASTEVGLKSQVVDLETRVAELLSTTASLETEVHGPSNQALLQEEKISGNHGLVPRMSVLKDKVSNLKSRVFILEHHIH